MSFALLVLNISIDQFHISGIALPFYRLPIDARFANCGRHRRLLADSLTRPWIEMPKARGRNHETRSSARFLPSCAYPSWLIHRPRWPGLRPRLTTAWGQNSGPGAAAGCAKEGPGAIGDSRSPRSTDATAAGSSCESSFYSSSIARLPIEGSVGTKSSGNIPGQHWRTWIFCTPVSYSTWRVSLHPLVNSSSFGGAEKCKSWLTVHKDNLHKREIEMRTFFNLIRGGNRPIWFNLYLV
jgi:hypothetical protein